MKDSEIEYINTFKKDHEIIYEYDYDEIYVIFKKCIYKYKLYLIDYKYQKNNIYDCDIIYNINDFIYHDKKLYHKKLSHKYYSIHALSFDGGIEVFSISINRYKYITNIEKIIKYDSADIIYICGYKIIIKNYKAPQVIKDDYFITNLLAIAKAAEDIKFSYE